jgi:hypothetical protein
VLTSVHQMLDHCQRHQRAERNAHQQPERRLDRRLLFGVRQPQCEQRQPAQAEGGEDQDCECWRHGSSVIFRHRGAGRRIEKIVQLIDHLVGVRQALEGLTGRQFVRWLVAQARFSV